MYLIYFGIYLFFCLFVECAENLFNTLSNANGSFRLKLQTFPSFIKVTNEIWRIRLSAVFICD